MTTFINRGVAAPAAYYRAPSYAQPTRPVADVRDDYERWYTETVPSNRMTLSIRSGIHTEVSWALDRLCRLAHNELFVFSTIPGIIDSLFDWPEWFVTEGYKSTSDQDVIFSTPPNETRQRRYALEALFVIRNAAFHEPNARELAIHSHTFPLIINTLNNLDHNRDEHAEALLHVIDIFHVLAPLLSVNLPHLVNLNSALNPVPPLLSIASQSSNRTMILASVTALTAIFTNPVNVAYFTPDSPALSASIRYLPLFVDKPLIDACLNYLYTHISHPPMARAFLLHPEFPGTLKVLANLLVHEQQTLEEKITIDVTGTIHTVPSTALATKDHDLTKEELDSLLGKPEPQRCYDWMRTMFVSKTEGEMTQVDFWNLYKDVFSPYQDRYPLLVASDVIKNVNNVFPLAQAMVLQGASQRFVVRGVDRRKDPAASERFRCQWSRSQCPDPPYNSPGELYDHVLEHLSEENATQVPCLWSSCSQPSLSKHAISSHLLTHLSSAQPPQKHPSQSDTITLPSENYPYPTDTPTSRPPPPPRSTLITYGRPIVDPPSTSLTALLIIRILFRTSFASAEAAPRIDANHFGFPGVVEEDDPEDFIDGAVNGDEREGERRGRKAFLGIRKFLECVRLRDEVLMSWVTEMTDAGTGDLNH